MTGYEILLLIHILLFVYWLGGDLGVFYSSNFVVDASLSREARLVAAKVMLGCDLVPRICMSLMLTIGGLLAATIGAQHSTWQLIAIVLLGPFWLSMVLVLHFKHDAPFNAALSKFDLMFRWFLIAALLVSVTYSYSAGTLAEFPWLNLKIILFAVLVFCGLMIRVKLKDFSNVYVKLLQDDYTDADNKAMARSLKMVKPWVVSIWIILIVEAYLGIVKPV